MEFIQVFDNESGLIGERIKIQAGYSESFVYDKSTDKAQGITFIADDSALKYKKDDWVLLLHLDDVYEPLSFDDKMRTTNATQYIIDSCECTKLDDDWIVKMALVEPINRFKSVVCETLSFTNQTEVRHATLDGGGNKIETVYYKAPYNYLTALERFLTVVNTITTATVSQSWLNRIKIDTDDRNWLESLPFPDETWNDLDLYRVLMDKYSIYDKMPVAYFDIKTVSVSPKINEDVSNRKMRLSVTANPLDAGTITFSSGYTLTMVWQLAGNYWTMRDDDNNIVWQETVAGLLAYKDIELGEIGKITAVTTTGLLNIFRKRLASRGTRDKYRLIFERTDGLRETPLELSSLTDKAMNITYTTADENATGIVSNVENMSSGFVTHYPAKDQFAFPELDQITRDTKSEGDNSYNKWHLRLPFKIKRINKLTRWEFETDVTGTGINIKYKYEVKEENKTSNVLEKSQFEAYPTNITGSRDYYWFKQGDNKLFVNDYYYAEGKVAYAYNVEYEPIIDARVFYGNNERTMQLNQTSGQVDSIAFGEYLNAYKDGLNKADVVIQKEYENYSEFENHIGKVAVGGDKKYIITQVAYQNIGVAGYVVIYQLNENHMRKNKEYQASQEILARTSIPIDDIKERKTTIKQVVNIATKSSLLPTNNSPRILLDKKDLFNSLISVGVARYPQYATIEAESTLYTNSSLTVSETYKRKVVAGLGKSLGDKQIHLVVEMFDNAEAGRIKEVSLVPEVQKKHYGDVNSQSPYLYTDPFGEAEKLNISIGNLVAEQFVIVGEKLTFDVAHYSGWTALFNGYKGIGGYPKPIALESGDYTETLSTSLIYKKDALEKTNLNISIEVNGIGCIITNEFLLRSRILDDINTPTIRFAVVNKKIKETDTDFNVSEQALIQGTAIANGIRLSIVAPDDITSLSVNKALTVMPVGINKPIIIFNELTQAQINTFNANKYIDIFYN